MVDVGDKAVTEREAVAEGSVSMRPETLATIRAGNAKKGDVVAIARIAGIMAAKRTHELIPLCHPLALDAVTVDIEPDDRLPGLRDPRRGDIIVFKYPQDESRDFIKRVIAVPGESLQVRGHDVLVDGRPLAEPYVKPPDAPLAHGGQPASCNFAYGCEPIVVPEDSYFVMGDNRDNSQDSRYWGFVRRDKIKGKAFLIYWSWDGDGHWLRWWRLGKYIP